MAHGVILGQTPNTNNLLPLDGSRAMTGSLNMGNHKITNVANGTNANDAVNFNQLNTSTIQASRISGVLGTSNIPNLAASKITSGTFDTARIPNLDASKITSGILPVARGGTGVSNLEDLGSNFIRKTTLNVDGQVDFFGNNGIAHLPFLLKANCKTSLELRYGSQGSTLFTSERNDFYVPLWYQLMSYGTVSHMSILIPMGLSAQYTELDFDSTGKVSVSWVWDGNATITFYSFV